MKTKIDLHSHTRGSDGTGTPASIALAAKAAGLHGLCLTDHHTNETDEVHKVAEALRNVGVLPIIGVEYSTQQGHLLIYGLTVPKLAWGMYPEMQAVIDDVNKLGGCCIVPHPFKGYQRALHGAVEKITGLVAVESLNGQVEVANPDTNRKAREAAKRMGLARAGASDAHYPGMIGLSFTEFEGEIPDEETFLEALRSGKFRAMRNDDLFHERQGARRAKLEQQLEDARRYTVPSPPPAPDGWRQTPLLLEAPREKKRRKKVHKVDSLLEAELRFREENGLDFDGFEDVAFKDLDDGRDLDFLEGYRLAMDKED